MKVKCISDKMDVFWDSFPKWYNKNQYVWLVLWREYIVMWIIKTESGIEYLIGDEDKAIYFEHEKFFTVVDFSITHNRSFDNWCFVSQWQWGFIDKTKNIEFIIWYKQLCLDENHYVWIFEREEKDLKIFYEELNKIRSFYEDRNFALKI
jgi:hypothetical protein